MRYSLSDNELFCVCVHVLNKRPLIPVRTSGTGSAEIGRISVYYWYFWIVWIVT